MTAPAPTTEERSGSAPRGRYAPSPTGLLHVGNARTALAAWLSVRSRGGTFVWRVEDLDPPRVVRGAAEAAVRDLAWMGLDWDEDPESGGPWGPYTQSERSAVYEAALAMLASAGRLFPCRLSRRELASISSAPHSAQHGDDDDEPAYPASARPASLDDGWYERHRRGEDGAVALRLLVDRDEVAFRDRVRGEVTARVGGDFVLKRRDGFYAYQLAVVVDDWQMRIDEVVRGADLLSSTPKQLVLLEALGAAKPVHAHVPMVLAPDGAKLSKRDGALTLQSLREHGVRPEQLTGYLAWSLGLLERPEPVAAVELVREFRWSRVGREDWRLPEDFPDRLRGLR